MSDIAVRVENLGKCYQIGQAKSGDFRESFGSWMDKLRGRSNGQVQESKEFWALKDINFEIKKGEAVGIIGRNGAGKSTLLKILSRITEPTKGRFEINGRVSSLLEVGTGFHPELSGRENIYLNGTILGMKRREIKAKFDEIVAFSGVEKFIDTPVKHYSSGMKVRLAFSVAAHLEPEILIVDEVLAVGDAEFQKKCLGKMDEVSKNEGRTVLFVSHNMGAVQNLCSKGFLINSGEFEFGGEIEKVIGKYTNSHKEQNKIYLNDRQDRGGNGKVRLTNISLYNKSSEMPIDSVLSGMDVYLKIAYEAKEYPYTHIRDLHLGLAIYNSQQQFVSVLNNKMSNFTFKEVPLEGEVICEIPSLPLMYGYFSLLATLEVDGDISDRIESAFSFKVDASDFFNSGMPNVSNRQGVYVMQSWELVSEHE
jgi:lipopolysaccharide transport system ATP-binding protein